MADIGPQETDHFPQDLFPLSIPPSGDNDAFESVGVTFCHRKLTHLQVLI
jgi:hypothetical protein